MKIFFPEIDHIQYSDEALDFSALSNIGELSLASHQNLNQLFQENYDAEVLIVGRLALPRDTLEKFSKLRLIVKAGTGLDKIDLVAARAQKVAVANLSGYAAEPVGQATMAFILGFASSVFQYEQEVRQGQWERARFNYPMMTVTGKYLGIVGLGGISKRVIQLAKSFGMHVQVFSRFPDRQLEIDYVDLKTIAQKSDFISLHCALDQQTRSMINAEFLTQTKTSAYLINTARAAVIDENAVIAALRENRIAGFAMDGFWREPPEDNHPLFGMRNVIITPHITWASIETRQWMINEMASVIADFFSGKPRNIVN